jgi:hypothetical protein
MKRGGPQHPKLRALARELEIDLSHAVGLAECLWHFAMSYALRGDVGRFSNADLSDAVGWTGVADRLIGALVVVRLIDQSEEHRLVLHGWSEHCDEAVHMALSRRRERFADGVLPKLGRLDGKSRPKAIEWMKVEQERDLTEARTCLVQGSYMSRSDLVHGSSSSPPLPSPPEEEEHSKASPSRDAAEPASLGDEIERPLRLLKKEPGSEAAKRRWLERELPLLLAEAERMEPSDVKARSAAFRSLIIRYWRQQQPGRRMEVSPNGPGTSALAERARAIVRARAGGADPAG